MIIRVQVNSKREISSSAHQDAQGSQNHALLHALSYINRGWHVIPMPPLTKKPIAGWEWKDAKVSIEAASELFGKFCYNVGVVLGQASGGLVDIDLDWPEARLIAEELGIFGGLPGFGRFGAQLGHRIAVCPEEQPGRGKRKKGDCGGLHKFELPGALKGNPRLPDEHELCVAELRGTGGYTMFPGSTHPSGESVCWTKGPPSDLPVPHGGGSRRLSGWFLSWLSSCASTRPWGCATRRAWPWQELY